MINYNRIYPIVKIIQSVISYSRGRHSRPRIKYGVNSSGPAKGRTGKHWIPPYQVPRVKHGAS